MTWDTPACARPVANADPKPPVAPDRMAVFPSRENILLRYCDAIFERLFRVALATDSREIFLHLLRNDLGLQILEELVDVITLSLSYCSYPRTTWYMAEEYLPVRGTTLISELDDARAGIASMTIGQRGSCSCGRRYLASTKIAHRFGSLKRILSLPTRLPSTATTSLQALHHPGNHALHLQLRRGSKNGQTRRSSPLRSSVRRVKTVKRSRRKRAPLIDEALRAAIHNGAKLSALPRPLASDVAKSRTLNSTFKHPLLLQYFVLCSQLKLGFANDTSSQA